MATVWGGWTANNRWRIGVNVTVTVSADKSTATVKTDVYFNVQYASNESGQSGTTVRQTSPWAAGPQQFDWNLGGNGTKLIASWSRNYGLNYGSTQTLTISESATVAYTYPGTGTVSTSVTLPARPYSAPAAPTGVSLTRGANESLTVAWTRQVSAAAPVDNYEVNWIHTKTSAWYPGATVSGGSSSYASNGATDLQYKARVRAKNSVGYSGWVETGWQSTTPNAPAKPTVTKDASGDILVGYAAPAAGSSAAQYEVWHAANGVWDAARLGVVASGTGTYRHAAPNPAQTHKYRLRAMSPNNPLLYSGYSLESDTVQLQAPPNAPTNLRPVGTAVDAAKVIDLFWQHNPVDQTPQRLKQFQWRKDGGAWQAIGITPGSTGNWGISANYWPNGSTIEWQVRTWGSATTGGSDGTGASPWSAIASFPTRATPTAAVNFPTSDPVAVSKLTATWGYYQAQGSVQTSWKAKLLDSTGKTLETKTGGAETSVTFDRTIRDGQDYSFSLEVRSSDGLWSAPTVQPFTVNYAEPPAPQVVAHWQPSEGAVQLDVAVDAPDAGQVEALYVDVYRAIGDSDEWVPVMLNVAPGTSITDNIPPLGQTVRYKGISTSALPSSAESAEDSVVTSDSWFVFINGGPGFSQMVKMSTNLVVDFDYAGEKALIDFGRPSGLPVEFSGRQQSNTWKISSKQWADWYDDDSGLFSPWNEVRDLTRLPGPHCFRLPDGTRAFVSLNGMGASDLVGSPSLGVDITVQQIDYTEDRAFIDPQEG